MNTRKPRGSIVSIYMLEGGTEKVGLWFLSVHFNYKRNAVEYRDEYHPRLKVVKFIKATASTAVTKKDEI